MVSKKIKNYRDLIVWQRGIKLVTELYKITNKFPKSELYSLTAQIRKSAIPIPSNIPEGYGRNSTRDYIRFLQITVGYLFELETQLEIANNLGYIYEKDYNFLADEGNQIERMLNTLISKNHNTKNIRGFTK